MPWWWLGVVVCKVVVVALFLGFCVGGVLYGFGDVGATDVAVDGEAVVIGGVGSQGGLAAAGGRSPVWPFRGIVKYAVSDTDSHMVLQYWNTDTGEVSEVQLGASAWLWDITSG